MNIRYRHFALTGIFLLAACSANTGKNVPVIGFADAFEDATIAQARKGFTDALTKNGFSENKHTVKIDYRNAQGDIPTLTQIINYFIGEKVTLMATCTTLASVTAAQKTKAIPVFMMVSPTLARMHLAGTTGKGPANLFGVVEDLNYIDTSFALIPAMLKTTGHQLKVGMIYNQAEPQSADALNRIKMLAQRMNITVIALPLNSSADAQLVTRALLDKHIDAFFANPDNTVFAAFETILKSCNEKHVPIFTSEAGLVQRGAVAAFGADIYQWGYQSGLQAAHYLKVHSAAGLKPEMVKIRKRVYNPAAAAEYHISIPSNFQPVR